MVIDVGAEIVAVEHKTATATVIRRCLEIVIIIRGGVSTIW
jgi:hypothetical protein